MPVNNEGLTDKQVRFCEEYIVDLNATQAAIRAGYSEKTANEQATRLLANVSIKQYIDSLIEKRSERTEITADMVVKELAKIGFADPTCFVDIKKQEVDGKIYKSVDIKATEDIDKEKLGAIAGIKQGANGIEIKLNDKVKALELLGKHLSMFNEKIDISGCVTFIKDDMPDE